MLIATLSAALVDGGYDDIIAIGIVANEEEGKFWFCNNKPTDGTQVDYVLHKIPEVFAAPDLLAACEMALQEWYPRLNGCVRPDCLVCARHREEAKQVIVAIKEAK